MAEKAPVLNAAQAASIERGIEQLNKISGMARTAALELESLLISLGCKEPDEQSKKFDLTGAQDKLWGRTFNERRH